MRFRIPKSAYGSLVDRIDSGTIRNKSNTKGSIRKKRTISVKDSFGLTIFFNQSAGVNEEPDSHSVRH